MTGEQCCDWGTKVPGREGEARCCGLSRMSLTCADVLCLQVFICDHFVRGIFESQSNPAFGCDVQGSNLLVASVPNAIDEKQIAGTMLALLRCSVPEAAILGAYICLQCMLV